MSILTFAIGALLAAVGLASVYHGYGIVEVERGWTEVIAGTVALVGGMVVMMLALLLGAIRDLRLASSGAHAAFPTSSAHAEPIADMAPTLAASLPPIPVSPPMPVPDPSLRPELETAARQVEAALFGGLEPQPDAVAPATEAPERGAGATGDAWHRLDAELARLDQEDASFAPATAPATLEPMSAATPETPAAEASERDPDAGEPELPLAAPEPPAVIGRYEADGTTYTMFADGTIEADTPEGTYHFGSMAELKAFVEAKV